MLSSCVEGKFLVQNEQEFVGLFKDVEEFEAVEQFLGIEYGIEDEETMFITKETWTKLEGYNGPKEYPCLVHVYFTDETDQYGEVHYRQLNFSYLSDFQTDTEDEEAESIRCLADFD